MEQTVKSEIKQYFQDTNPSYSLGGRLCCAGDGTADHSYRKASVGFRSAARLAGSMPNPTPTETDTMNAVRIDSGESGILKSDNSRTPKGSAMPIRMPMKPPPTLIMMDSIRNCPRISLREAPTAFARRSLWSAPSR